VSRENPADAREEFLDAATWHGSLERAKALLAAHPELASSDIHTAAVLGDDVAVRRFLAHDPENATAKSVPFGADAIVYLCLSKYLRFDQARSDAFVGAATALLDAGADPNSGFWTTGQHPEFETALYGAAGVAHHAPMTRLLIDRGANPNDIEAVYHSPESDDFAAMAVLVETGRVTPENLSLMLIRKHDWHDYDGAKYLLEHSTDPNLERDRPGWLPIHHAIARDNSLEMIELLLDHGADPSRPAKANHLRGDGGRMTAIGRAARRGRGDVLALFQRRGIPLALEGVERLIAACAMDDAAEIREITTAHPQFVQEVVAQGGTLLPEFAGTWNAKGVERLLDLGVDIEAPYAGDGYNGIPKDSTALHVAAWKSTPPAVLALIARGAQVNARDGNGRTPLALAVRACVDSYWTHRRSPESVWALLDAGASVSDVTFPSGYHEVDALLKSRGAKG
jgi:ankyrin repeat protein